MSAQPRVQALLFDLGGVVVDIDFGRVLDAWQPHSALPRAQLRQRFSFDPPYQRHETGALEAAGYFDHLRQQLALSCDDATMAAGWNAVFTGAIDETLALIDGVRERVPCYAISNTNAVHLAELERAFPAVLARFRQVFVSHAIGHRKPQPEAFAHVLRAIGVPAAGVMFFDDLADNVDGARACGMQGVVVTGPADVRRALQAAGLV